MNLDLLLFQLKFKVQFGDSNLLFIHFSLFSKSHRCCFICILIKQTLSFNRILPINFTHLWLIILLHPLFSTSVFPDANFDLTIGVNILALAFLLAFNPLSFDPFTIGEVKCPKTMFLVVLKLSYKQTTILIMQLSLTIHSACLPFTYINSTVTPTILPMPFELIILPLTFIARPIFPSIVSIPMLLAMIELT